MKINNSSTFGKFESSNDLRFFALNFKSRMMSRATIDQNSESGRMMREYIMSDFTVTEHLRMLEAVQRKPANTLPPLRQIAWNVLAAISVM